MHDFFKRAIVGAAVVSYALAENQTNSTENGTKPCDTSLDLTYATSIILAGATVSLASSIIGCVSQLVATYNFAKANHRQQTGTNTPLLEIKARVSDD